MMRPTRHNARLAATIAAMNFFEPMWVHASGGVPSYSLQTLAMRQSPVSHVLSLTPFKNLSGRNYIGHYIDHNCIGHRHMGHNYIGHNRTRPFKNLLVYRAWECNSAHARASVRADSASERTQTRRHAEHTGHARPRSTTTHHTIPYHTIPYHTIPYHTIPHHTTPHHPVALTEGIFLILYFTPPSDFALDGIFLRDENGENFKP